MPAPNPIHAGQMLVEEFLVPGAMTHRAFAAKRGWTTARLNELIRGKRSVTSDAAVDLAAALKTSHELWLTLQMHYGLHQVERARKRGS